MEAMAALEKIDPFNALLCRLQLFSKRKFNLLERRFEQGRVGPREARQQFVGRHGVFQRGHRA